MLELEQYTNDKFGAIRVTMINGEPWFVGKDVAEKLGYSNARDALLKHVDGDDKGVSQIATPSGEQSMIVINESGLYSLILSSKLPTAREFKHWVTSEVLPSIRRHGIYATPATAEQILGDPDFLIQTLQALKKERTENARLKKQNQTQTRALQIMEPKAACYDALVESDSLVSFRESAKLLSVGEKALIQFLLDRHYLYRSPRGKLLPYAEMQQKGLFEVREVAYGVDQISGKMKMTTYTKVTQKGLTEIFRKLAEEQQAKENTTERQQKLPLE